MEKGCSAAALHTPNIILCVAETNISILFIYSHIQSQQSEFERERERRARKQPKTEEEELENGKRNCESCDQAKRSRRRGHEIYSPEARRIRERKMRRRRDKEVKERERAKNGET